MVKQSKMQYLVGVSETMQKGLIASPRNSIKQVPYPVVDLFVESNKL